MTTVEQRPRQKADQLRKVSIAGPDAKSTPVPSRETMPLNCVVSIVTDDDSDPDTLKSNSPPTVAYPGPNRSPPIKHVSSSASFIMYCTPDTIDKANIKPSQSQQQLSANRNQLRYQATRQSGSVAGCAPILLSVPTAGPPRRRHSWICGYVIGSFNTLSIVSVLFDFDFCF